MLALVFAVAVAGFAEGRHVLIEAENFDELGGWSNDQQYMDQMGSPFLIAHGLGHPVEDAVTRVTLPATGTYRVWVRTVEKAGYGRNSTGPRYARFVQTGDRRNRTGDGFRNPGLGVALAGWGHD